MARRGNVPKRFSQSTDYQRQPGPDRRYAIPGSGTSISRRQYENMRVAEQTGFTSWSQWQYLGTSRTAEGKEYRAFLQRASEDTGRTAAELRAIDSPFNRLWTNKQDEAHLPADERNRPRGALARFLEGLGIRAPNAPYPVGSSPKQ